MRSTGHSHPVSIIGPVITGNAFFPIWYHIHAFAGPRELGWSDTLYSFLESDGAVQCNAPTCTICLALALALSGPGPEGPGQGQSGSGPGPIEIFIDNFVILYFDLTPPLSSFLTFTTWTNILYTNTYSCLFWINSAKVPRILIFLMGLGRRHPALQQEG